MNKKLLIKIFCFLLSWQFATAQSYQWAQGEGGTNEDRAFGVATDIWGNVYVTGSFRSTATFGTTVFSSAGVEDAFLAKYDSSGNFLWAKRFGGQSIDIGYDAATDDSGNCYIAGVFYNIGMFGSITLQSSGTGDAEIFILKTDSSGTILWAKSAGSPDYDLARGLTVSGNKIYVTGVFSDTAAFDAVTVNGAGLQDVFLARYDLNGNAQWAIAGGGTGYDVGYGVATDAAGNACVTGYFQSQASFGTIPLTNASALYVDMFVFKADSTGQVLWAKRGGATNDDDAGRSIAADSAGNVYVAGEIRASGNFDTINYTNAGIAEIYMAKYNSSGTIQYLAVAGGGGGDYAYGIAASSSAVFITGLFNSTAQFGTISLASAGINDIYLARIDAASGNFTHAIRAGGTGDEAGRAVAVYKNNTVVQAGDFEHTPSSFTPFTLSSNGSHDMFAARIGFDLSTEVNENENEGSVSVFPNPSSGWLNVEFRGKDKVGKKLLTIFDMSGSKVWEEEINSPLLNIHFRLANGVYLLKVFSSGKFFMQKLVVN